MLERLKSLYSAWLPIYKLIPKNHQYSFGLKIDSLLIEVIEAVSAAVFLIKQDKLPFLKLAIRKLDTIKILLLVGWENKFIMNTKYADLSLKLDKIGKMLGGWKGKLEKENSSSLFKREEK